LAEYLGSRQHAEQQNGLHFAESLLIVLIFLRHGKNQ